MKSENLEFCNIASRVQGAVLPVSRLEGALVRKANPNIKIRDRDNTPAFAVALSGLTYQGADFSTEYNQAKKCIELFSRFGANFKLKNKSGLDALGYCTHIGSEPSSAAILDCIAFDEELDAGLFAEAASHGMSMMPVLHRLTTKGLSPDSLTFNHEQSALGAAVEYNEFEVVKYLLSVGADINIKDKFDATPLMYACSSRVISGRWEYGGPPMGFEMINYLIINGADPTLKSKQRKTALSLVKKSNDFDEEHKKRILDLLKNST